METTLRQQVETDMTSWAEWHRSHGRAVKRADRTDLAAAFKSAAWTERRNRAASA